MTHLGLGRSAPLFFRDLSSRVRSCMLEDSSCEEVRAASADLTTRSGGSGSDHVRWLEKRCVAGVLGMGAGGTAESWQRKREKTQAAVDGDRLIDQRRDWGIRLDFEQFHRQSGCR
uniref:Uncharacterized protein n=1 Tax=Leersia perrieri TaxID=77586 RepID=A0A0D9VC07_9ORYZ